MMLGEFWPLRLLPLGSRFRFHAPRWGVKWDGEVIRHGHVGDKERLRAVFVVLDAMHGDRPAPRQETPWNPDIVVEVLRDGPARD